MGLFFLSFLSFFLTTIWNETSTFWSLMVGLLNWADFLAPDYVEKLYMLHEYWTIQTILI